MIIKLEQPNIFLLKKLLRELFYIIININAEKNQK